MKIKNIFGIGILVLVIIQFGILSAQEQEIIVASQETGELIDICALKDSPIGCGSDLSLSGENLKISKEGDISFTGEGGKLILNQGKENEIILEGTKEVEINPITGKINFVGEGSSITINGNKFENIAPIGDQVKEAFINFDRTTGEISEAKFWTAEKRGIYTMKEGVKFYAPPFTQVKYNSKDKTLYLGGKGSEWFKQRGEEQEGNIKIKDIKDITISGENIEVSEGYIMQSGTLGFDGKNIFVGGNNRAIINNVEVNMKKHSSFDKVNLFFDGNKHEGTYVSFGENKIIYSKGEASYLPEINFDEGNKYIKIEKGDHVSLLGDFFVLENRDSNELIPKIIVSGDTFLSYNDGKIIYYDGEKWLLDEASERPELLKTTTSPLEIVIDDPKIDGKIFVDNFNRLVIAPKKYNTKYITESEGIDTKFSSRVKYNYIDYSNEEEMKKITKVPINFKETSIERFMGEGVTEGQKQLALGRLRDYWNNLNEETQKSIYSINFMDVETLKIECEAENAGGCYRQLDGSINFAAQDPYFNYNTFRHESAHARHFQLMGEVADRILSDKPELMKELTDAVSEVNSYEEGTSEYNIALERFSKVYNNIKNIAQEELDFNKKWNKVAGPYDKVVEDEEGDYAYPKAGKFIGLLTELHGASVSGVPLFGYASPYGGSDIKEDVAEFVGKAKKPEFFKPLLAEDNQWHEIYRKKLDLLYQYKYITKSEYKTILKEAGIK